MTGYFISSEDINLERGCCSCPLKTGNGRFCGRLIENDYIEEHVKKYTRPDNCPLHKVESVCGIINLDNVPIHTIQEWHQDLQRPGFPKQVMYVDDIQSARIDLKENK
jgi:hypothetical protein